MSKPEQKNILLIGSNYIASNIALRLMGLYKEEPQTIDENIKLTVMDIAPPDLLFLNPKLARFQEHEAIKRAHVSQWDFDVFTNYRNFDAIINASTVSDSEFSAINPVHTIINNEVFTTKLLDVLRRIDFSGRLIHVSSHHAYGKIEPRKFTREPVTEEEECKPYGIRSASTRATEIIIEGMCKLHGLRYVILRFGTLFGDFVPQSKSMYTWTKAMMMREDLPLYEPNKVLKPFSEGASSRDFVHEYDACGAVIQLCLENNRNKTDIDQEIYNIGGQGATANGEIFITNLALATKWVFKNWNPDAKLIFKGWRGKDEAEKRIWMSSKKANKKFGYDPVKDLVHSTKNISYFIAQYDLGWGTDDMFKWKKYGTTDIDAGLEMAYKSLHGEDTGVSKDMLETMDRGAGLVGKED